MSEAFYDIEVAPVLLELAKKCEAEGLPFIAGVEYQPGDWGSTSTHITEKASFPIRLAWAALTSGRNIDAIFMFIEKWARKVGHSSMFLHRIGVPLKPTAEGEQA